MVDKEMLEAIGQMMDAKLAKQKAEILAESNQNMKVLLDTEVQTQFNRLAEGQNIIVERLDRIEDKLEKLEAKVGAHEIKLRVVD